jgi:hypothetical protein
VDTHAIDCTYNLIAAVFDSVCPARPRIVRLNAAFTGGWRRPDREGHCASPWRVGLRKLSG